VPRVLLWIVLAAAGAYLAICVIAWVRQDRLVWFPGPPPRLTPTAIGAPYEELELTARDGARVHAWHVRAGAPRGAVLVCHGNAGNVEDRLPLAATFRELGWDVLLFDYRGYGRSRGTLSEEGTYLDGEAALDHLAARGYGPGRTVLYGESLGGAVAVELARRRGAAALLVENAFTSLSDVGARVYPWLPVRLLTRVHYDSLAKVPALSVPLLVLHSRDDELVPYEHGERLHAAHPGPKRLIETRGGHGSGGFLQRREWTEEVARFLLEHARPG
jgi:hypothetical protein